MKNLLIKILPTWLVLILLLGTSTTMLMATTYNPGLEKLGDYIITRLHNLQVENSLKIARGEQANYFLAITPEDLLKENLADDNILELLRLPADREKLNSLWPLGNPENAKTINDLLANLQDKQGNKIAYYVVKIGLYNLIEPHDKLPVNWQDISNQSTSSAELAHIHRNDYQQLFDYVAVEFQKKYAAQFNKESTAKFFYHFAISSFLIRKNEELKILNFQGFFDNLTDLPNEVTAQLNFELKPQSTSEKPISSLLANVSRISEMMRGEFVNSKLADTYFERITLPNISGLPIKTIDSLAEATYQPFLDKINQLQAKRNNSYAYKVDMAASNFHHIHIDDELEISPKDVELLDHKLTFLAENSRSTAPVDIYIVFHKVDAVINGNWNAFADRVYKKAKLKNAILVTIPYYKIRADLNAITSASVAYYMPGLAFTANGHLLNVKTQDIGKIPTLQLEGNRYVPNSSYYTVSKSGALDFINRVYVQTYKPTEIQVAYQYFDGNIERKVITQEYYQAGYDFSRKALLFQYPEAQNLHELNKRVKQLNALIRSKHAAPQAFEELAAARKRMHQLIANITNDPAKFKPFEPAVIIKEKYTTGDYFLAYALQQFNEKDDATLKNLLIGIGANRDGLHKDYLYNFNKQVWDKKVYNTIDAASIALSPLGFDFLPDGIGLIYAGLRGDYVDAGLYLTSVIIVTVPGGALKLLKPNEVASNTLLLYQNKYLLHTGNGNLVETSLEKATILSTFELDKLDNLSTDLALKLFDDLNANKITDDVIAQIKQIGNSDDRIRALSNLAGGGGAMFSKAGISSLKGFSDDIYSILTRQSLSLEDFKILQQKRYDLMNVIEKHNIDLIRKSIPIPDENTILQKVIPKEDILKYTSGQYKQIGGFISTAKDAKHLNTFEDIYYGMRLDYPNTSFKLSDGSCGVIRYKTKTPNLEIVKLTGTSDDLPLPFTGNGFTGGKEGKLGTPEWKSPYYTPTDGSELWEVFSDGSEILRAKFSESKNIFITIK